MPSLFQKFDLILRVYILENIIVLTDQALCYLELRERLATVSAFIMNVFIAELNVFSLLSYLSSGPRQRNKVQTYINSKKSE